MNSALLPITALIALIPALVVPFRRSPKRDSIFWIVLIVAIFGAMVLILVRQSTGWKTGISTALWLTILACLVLYFLVAYISDDGWRLTPLLLPYLFILGILATFWSHSPDQPLVSTAPIAWISTHVVVSVATYGLVTLAAVAALAAAVQARALKNKKQTKLSRLLPPVATSEKLVLQLLFAGELVLAVGLVTGMASLYFATGKILIIDHKSIFTFIVFVIIGLLLFAHYRSGTRGKTATHMVLLAYLLLTLGYPGVKFVTDIILI